MSERLSDVLREVGARLKRQKRHMVYELPNGRIVSMSQTPSDVNGHKQAIRDLRRAARQD